MKPEGFLIGAPFNLPLKTLAPNWHWSPDTFLPGGRRSFLTQPRFQDLAPSTVCSRGGHNEAVPYGPLQPELGRWRIVRMETKEKPAVRGAYQDVWPMSGKVPSGPFPTFHPIEIPLASTNLGKNHYVHGNA